MKSENRAGLVIGLLLIGLGGLFLASNLLTGFDIILSWPIIFFILAAGFAIWPFIFPQAKQGLAGLLIPAAILATLGSIFMYNTLTTDWGAWAYLWILLPGGVGLGLVVAGWVGEWGRTTVNVGLWMLGISLVVFAFFSTLFGEPALKIAGSSLLILAGGTLLWRALQKPKTP